MSFLVNIFLAKNHTLQVFYSPYFNFCYLWLFPKLKLLLTGKRFKITDVIKENAMMHPMVIYKVLQTVLKSRRDVGIRVSILRMGSLKLTGSDLFLLLLTH